MFDKTLQLRNGATAQRRNGATAQRRNGATAQRRNGATAQRLSLRSDVTSPALRDMLRVFSFSSHFSFTSFVLCILLIFSIVNTHSLHADTTSNTNEAARQKSHSPHIEWPSKEYLEICSMIENGNNDRAIETINKAFSGLFPYRIPVTNGYPMAFFYYDALADAYMNEDNPVDAIEMYRVALYYPSTTVITQHPIAYAKVLFDLSSQFTKINRLADAEGSLKTALELVDNNTLEAEYYWIKSVRACAIGDMVSAANYAQKCIDILPGYKWEAYFNAGLSFFAQGKKEDAIDAWLDGLQEYANVLHIKSAVSYLNAFLPYLKDAHYSQITRYYDILTMLMLTHPAQKDTVDILERIMLERLKIEMVLTEKSHRHDIEKILLEALNNRMSTKENSEKWQKKDCIQFKTPFFFIDNDELRKKVNTVLSLEAQNTFRRAAYEWMNILTNESVSHQENVRVQNYPLKYYCLSHLSFLHAELEGDEIARDFARDAVNCIVSNNTYEGISYCPEEFYRLMMCKGGVEKRTGYPIKCEEAWQWASEISPESIDPKQCILKHKADISRIDNSLEDTYVYMEEFLDMPFIRPWYKYWYDQSYVYWQLAEKGLWKEDETPSKRAIDRMLDAFQYGIFDFKAHHHQFCNVEFSSLMRLDLFRDIIWHENAGEFNEEQYVRLYNSIKKYAVTIPADFSEIGLINNALEWIKHFSSIERTTPIELTFICNAAYWRDKNDVWLCTDYERPIQMTHLSNDIWKASIFVQPPTFLVKYIISKAPIDIRYKSYSNKISQVFLVSDECNKMNINVNTDRDYTIKAVFHCTAKNSDVKDTLYITGNNDTLGQWTPNTIRMYNDGTHGDEVADDETWTYIVDIAPSINKIQYKYTKNGKRGTWDGDESLGNNRELSIKMIDPEKATVRIDDIFGEL